MSFDVLASGFGLAEGPTAGPGGVLYVSDALLGGVRRLDPDGGERHLLAGRRGIGGLAMHAGGGLLASGATSCCWTASRCGRPSGQADGLAVDQAGGVLRTRASVPGLPVLPVTNPVPAAEAAL